MKRLLSAIVPIVLSTAAISQTPDADYARYTALVKSAYSVPERTYTYRIESKSTYSGSTSGYSSSSSGSTTPNLVSLVNALPRFNVNASSLRRQEAAARAQQARKDEWDAKENLLNELIAKRGLMRVKEDYYKLKRAAKEAGHTDYYFSRVFGDSPEDMEAREKAKMREHLPKFTGSTKDDCQGDCSENLTGKNVTYTGNTKNGVPDGKGKMVFENCILTGNFIEGTPEGMVTIDYTSANAKYVGGYANNFYDGEGYFISPDGDTTFVTHKNGIKLNEKSFLAKNNVILYYDFQHPENSYRNQINDGILYKGPIDNEGNRVRGITTYPGGASFNGSYKDNYTYRGRLDYNSGQIDFGQFAPKSNQLEVGMIITGKDTVLAFARDGAVHTYLAKRKADFIKEEARDNNGDTPGYCFYVRNDGSLYSIVPNYKGYENIGTRTLPNGEIYYGYLKKDGTWEVKDDDPTFVENAKAASKIAAEAVYTARKKFDDAMKPVYEVYKN